MNPHHFPLPLQQNPFNKQTGKGSQAAIGDFISLKFATAVPSNLVVFQLIVTFQAQVPRSLSCWTEEDFVSQVIVIRDV